MQFILEGLMFGLILVFAVGPIFILQTQTSIEHGWKAGMIVGLGVWVSDIIYIYTTLKFVQLLDPIFADPHIQFWMGMIGGGVLLLFGLYLIFKKQVLHLDTTTITAKSFAEYFAKGFAVNTFNPFTPIFWLGVISSNVLGRGISVTDTVLFLGTILTVIVVADSTKIFLAQAIRNRLTNQHIHYVSVISGSFLLIIGLWMMIRVV